MILKLFMKCIILFVRVQKVIEKSERMSSRHQQYRAGSTWNKAYCKVCHDSGLSVSEYTSHFVRDKPGLDGIVICPTILSMVCKYCGESAHTQSHCPKMSRDERERGKRQHERDRAHRVATWEVVESKKLSSKAAAKPSGRFSGLCSDSDSDSEPVKKSRFSKTKEPAEEYPMLSIKVTLEPVMKASAKKNAVHPILDCISNASGVVKSKPVPLAINVLPKIAPWVKSEKIASKMKRSWADDSDDDDAW